MSRLGSRALLLVVGFTLGACARPQAAPRPDPETPDLDEGMPRVRQRLQALVRQVPSASPERRLDIGREISAHGSAATPVLLSMLHDRDPAVRSLGAWVLGFREDRRVVPALEEASHDPVSHVALEAAASMVRLGDPRGTRRLVDGLEDPDPAMRSRSILLLRHTTGTTMDYQADADPEDRAAAVARWRDWLARREAAGLP